MTALVSDDWERQLAARDLIDILDPSSVRLDGVGRESDQLGTTLSELGLKLCKGTKLSGADWSIILWVREEDNPVVTDKLVEVDRSVGGLGLEVGGSRSQTETV